MRDLSLLCHAARAVESLAPGVLEPRLLRLVCSGIARRALSSRRSRRALAPPSNNGMHPTANSAAFIR